MSIWNIFNARGAKPSNPTPVSIPVPAGAAELGGVSYAGGRRDPSMPNLPPTAEEAAQTKITVAPPKPRRLAMFIPPGAILQVGAFIQGRVEGPLAKLRTEVLREAGVSELLSDAERSSVLALQQPWDNTEKFLLNLVRQDPASEWYKAQQEMAERVRDGRGSEVLDCDGWSVSDYKNDKYQKSKALKDQLRGISAQCIPTQQAVAERIGRVAGVLAERFAEKEKRYAAEWGLEYAPSKLVQVLGYMADNWEKLVPPSSAGPANCLKFANIDL